jgi:integrase
VTQVFGDYARAQERAGLSKKHLKDIRQRVGLFVAKFGERQIKTISVNEIEDHLHNLRLSPQTINNHRARLSAFFEYALKRSSVEQNPVTPIAKRKLIDQPPEIFKPTELIEMLSCAKMDILPSIAIQAFTGIRTAELLRLDWSEIDLARCYVTVTAAKAKTAARRLIPIAPNLADWLRPYAGSSGAVWPGTEYAYHYAINAVVSRTSSLRKRPQNGFRHSFASYYLAEHQNAAELALHLGHTSTKLIFSTYRELVTPEAAHEYWRIRPAAPQNIVVMKKAAV